MNRSRAVYDGTRRCGESGDAARVRLLVTPTVLIRDVRKHVPPIRKQQRLHPAVGAAGRCGWDEEHVRDAPSFQPSRVYPPFRRSLGSDKNDPAVFWAVVQKLPMSYQSLETKWSRRLDVCGQKKSNWSRRSSIPRREPSRSSSNSAQSAKTRRMAIKFSARRKTIA